MRPLWMAIRLLTAVPTPGVRPYGPEVVVGSLTWFPVVGGVVGAVSGLAAVCVERLGGGRAAGCAAAMGVGLLLTRGAHIRGLTVMLGALFSGRDPVSLAALAAHRWPTRFGVLAGTAALLLRYALLLALPRNTCLAALVLSGGLSRTAIVWVAWRFPYASVDTGLAGYLATLAGARDLLFALPILAVGYGTINPIWATTALAAAWALPHLFAGWVSRALGGVNANTFDAVAEVSEVAALGAMGGCAYMASVGVL